MLHLSQDIHASIHGEAWMVSIDDSDGEDIVVVHRGDDFDLSLHDLGMSGVAAGGAGRDDHVHRRHGTDTGRGGHAVGQDEVTDLGEVVVGEHEAEHPFRKFNVVFS